MQQPGFWDDPQKSAPLLQKRRMLERRKKTIDRLVEDQEELETWRELLNEGEGEREAVAFLDDVEKRLVLYDQRVDWQEGQPIPVRGEGTPVAFEDDEPLRRECRHFLECIETRATPRTDGVQGLRVLQVLEAAQRTLVQNGLPTALGMRER